LASGSGAPDFFTAEIAYLKSFIDGDFWDNLSKAPYNAEELVKDKTAEYVLELSRDKDGNLKALSWQSTAGALMYNRDIAREVLGTDDPAEVSKWTSNWDSFLELGRKIKDVTGGTKYLVSDTGVLWRIVFASRTNPWVKNGKLYIDDVVTDFFDVGKSIRKEGLDAAYPQWSGSWSGSMANGDVFCYILPTWGLHYVLKPNAGEAMIGHYGLATPPDSYYWGGTWIGIYKDAAADPKAVAWAFIKMFCIDDEYMEYYAKKTGDFLSNLKVVEKIKDEFSDDFLAGQNHYAYFYEEAKKVNGKLVTAYDLAVESAVGNNYAAYVEDEFSKEEAIQTIKDDVQTAYPDINVD